MTRPCCGCKNKTTPDAYYDGPSGAFVGYCGCECHPVVAAESEGG